MLTKSWCNLWSPFTGPKWWLTTTLKNFWRLKTETRNRCLQFGTLERKQIDARLKWLRNWKITAYKMHVRPEHSELASTDIMAINILLRPHTLSYKIPSFCELLLHYNLLSSSNFDKMCLKHLQQCQINIRFCSTNNSKLLVEFKSHFVLLFTVLWALNNTIDTSFLACTTRSA